MLSSKYLSISTVQSLTHLLQRGPHFPKAVS